MTIHIEIAFATPVLQKVIPLAISDSTSVTDAIIQANINAFFPEYDLITLPCGIWRMRLTPPHDYQFKNGDRLEIYRPLAKTPNQARLARAAKP
jgi:putative ubiquitin-RnfH superfamily antitoxin RatB of RatAB toxin-antitoxin module